MTQMTEKQQRFVANKAAGVNNREAAIAAGYSANTADVQAANLMRRADIKAAITAVTKNPDLIGSPSAMPRANYESSLEFLLDVVNHANMPPAMRLDAAKALLPYQHARLGEQGKKEAAKQRARETSQKPRLAPKTPPPLRIIEGGEGRRSHHKADDAATAL